MQAHYGNIRGNDRRREGERERGFGYGGGGGGRGYEGSGYGGRIGGGRGRGGGRREKERGVDEGKYFQVQLNLFKITHEPGKSWCMYDIEILPLCKFRTADTDSATPLSAYGPSTGTKDPGDVEKENFAEDSANVESQPVPESFFIEGNKYMKKDRDTLAFAGGSNERTREVLNALCNKLLEEGKTLTTTGGTIGVSPKPIFEEREKGYGILVNKKIPFWIILRRTVEHIGATREDKDKHIIQCMDTCLKHCVASGANWTAFGDDTTNFYLPEDQQNHLLEGRGRIFRNFRQGCDHLEPAVGASTAIKTCHDGSTGSSTEYYLALSNCLGFLYKVGTPLLISNNRYPKIAGVPIRGVNEPIKDSNLQNQIMAALKKLKKFSVKYEKGDIVKKELRTKNPDQSEEEISKRATFFKEGLKMRKKGDEAELIKWSARDEVFEFNGKEVNVYEYFKERHGITLRYPDMPIILCGRLGYFPIEFLYQEADRLRNANEQAMTDTALRYHDSFSGSERIDHIKKIREDVDRKNASQNLLLEFALKIERTNAVFQARRLRAPDLLFGNNVSVHPDNGSINLAGKGFAKPADLTSYVAVDLTMPERSPSIGDVLSQLCNELKNHGINMQNHVGNLSEVIVSGNGSNNFETIRDSFRAAVDKAKEFYLERSPLFFTNIVRKDGEVKKCWVVRTETRSHYCIPDDEEQPTHHGPNGIKARIQFKKSGKWLDPYSPEMAPEEGHLVEQFRYRNLNSTSHFSDVFDTALLPRPDLVLGSWQIQCPSIVFFYLPDDSKDVYNCIKMIGDIEFGINTQCMVQQKCQKNQGSRIKQYCSNIAHKVNSKLFSKTNDAVTWQVRNGLDWFFAQEAPTLVIGYAMSYGIWDGKPTTVVAGSVCFRDPMQLAQEVKVYFDGDSKDKGFVNPKILEDLVKTLAISFMVQHSRNGPPRRVLVYRDGGADGSFDRIKREELTSIRNGIGKAIKVACNWAQTDKVFEPNITFVVAQSNHNIVQAPAERADSINNNVPSGTVVSNIFAGDYAFDFLLTSQGGLKGTSKPLYFKVLVNENGKRSDFNDDSEILTQEKLENLTYQLGFQYGKATKAPRKLPVLLCSELLAERVLKYQYEYIDRIIGEGHLEIDEETKEFVKSKSFHGSKSLISGHSCIDDRCEGSWRVPFNPTITA